VNHKLSLLISPNPQWPNPPLIKVGDKILVLHMHSKVAKEVPFPTIVLTLPELF